MSFTVYPALDISNGALLRPLQRRVGAGAVSSQDPVEVAAAFSRAGAAWLHVVDLDGARIGAPANRELLLEVVAETDCPVQASGGLRTEDDAAQLLEAGARRVVLGAAALRDPEELARAAHRHPARIALSLDARGGPGRAWTLGRGGSVLEAVRSRAAREVWGFVYTNLERDGTLEGPDFEGLAALLEATERPVIAAGGVASLEQLSALRATGAAGAIVGRALYDGTFLLEQALARQG